MSRRRGTKPDANNLVENLPCDDVALKIYAEYSPAPDVEQDRVFFRISIIQTVEDLIWVYMVTFVTIDNKVISTSTRNYPRELERSLLNCARSLETTLLNSDIEFRTSSVNCWTAGLIGPLTRKQDRCRTCTDRTFATCTVMSKTPIPFEGRRSNNTTNVDYVENLIRQSLQKVNTRNRISVYSVQNREGRRNMWISLRKPTFVLGKILSKSYNHKLSRT